MHRPLLRPISPVLLLALALAALIIGCTQPTSAPTPTIAWSSTGCAGSLAEDGHDLAYSSVFPADAGKWRSNADFAEARTYLVTSSAESEQVQRLLNRSSQTFLAGVDLDRYYCVAIFDGLKGNGCSGVAIERLRPIGDTLYVYAHTWGAVPHQVCEQAVNNPVDIVRIERSEGVPADARLQLCLHSVTPSAPGAQ